MARPAEVEGAPPFKIIPTESLSVVYVQLTAIPHARMAAERQGHLLHTTALPPTAWATRGYRAR